MSKSIKARLLAAVGAATLLSACVVGPDFKAPDAPTTMSYVAANDTAPAGLTLSPNTRAAGPWWTALGNADLDSAIRQALAGSPSIAEATAAIERAKADLSAANGARYPALSLDASAERERINTEAFGFSGFPSPTVDLYSIGTGVTFDLDLFGKQRRASEAAAARVAAETHRADAAYLTLTGKVALQAIRIAALNEQVATVKSVIASDQQMIDMITRAEAIGGASASQASAGQGQLAQDLALLPPLERDLANARHQMALLVGKSPADYSAPSFSLAGFTQPTTLPASLPSELVHARPDILAAEADLHDATANIGVATADLYPDLEINVGLTQTTQRTQDLFNRAASGWNIGPSISIPLFDRTLLARRQAAEAEAKTSLARYQGVVLRAFLEVSNAMTNLAQDQQEVTALAAAESSADNHLRSTRASYEIGGGPLIDVIDGQRSLSQAQRKKVEAQGRVLEDLVQFYTATGANWK